MRFRTSFAFAFALCIAVPVAVAACGGPSSPGGSGGDAGGSGSSSGSSGSSGGFGSSGGNCPALIVDIPAVITVENATGAPIPCDATITILAGPGTGGGPPSVISCNAGAPIGYCPASDAGTSCPYALEGNGADTYTVQVAQAGFVSQVVTGVTTGEQSCESSSPASHVTVKLEPVSTDASVDGEAD
jgi:hypothetical protein